VFYIEIILIPIIQLTTTMSSASANCQYDFDGLSQSDVQELQVKMPNVNYIISPVGLLNLKVNIMIPNVNLITSARYIYQKFIDLNIGVIRNIRFEKYSETSTMKRAYIQLYGWFQTTVAENIQRKMTNTGFARVVYNDPVSWKIIDDVSNRIYTTGIDDHTMFFPPFDMYNIIDFNRKKFRTPKTDILRRVYNDDPSIQRIHPNQNSEPNEYDSLLELVD